MRCFFVTYLCSLSNEKVVMGGDKTNPAAQTEDFPIGLVRVHGLSKKIFTTRAKETKRSFDSFTVVYH